MPTPPLPSRDDDEHGAMPADCRVETLARMLRATWLQREPVPSAGNFDDLGPIMRQAWMDTGAAVRALLENRLTVALASTDDFFDGLTDDGRPTYDATKMDAEIRRVLGSPS